MSMEDIYVVMMGLIIGLFFGVAIGIDLARWAFKQRLKRLKGEIDDREAEA